MRILTSILLAAAATRALCLPHTPRSPPHEVNEPLVQDALFDGKCFYPRPTPSFNLTAYLGTWYQLAGTPFGPTTGARCVAAEYVLNDNNTVHVRNTAVIGTQELSIEGTASPASRAYGEVGAFNVVFPGEEGAGAECEGPNYIVQEFEGEYAVVQTRNWTTAYVLGRRRVVGDELIEAWIERAVALGSDRERISRVNQTSC